MRITKKFISFVLALLMILSCVSIVCFAEETENTEHLAEVPEGYIGIYTKDDLDNVKLNMAGKYILMNDIVFEDSDYEKGSSFYNSGKGWEPIGTSSTKFTGVFDGNGYTIKNLYINNTQQNYIGLFGYAYCATITRVSLQNINITGKDYVGGIAGASIGSTTISYCNVQGAVNGTNYVGGIVGRCYNDELKYSYVLFSSNTASVTAKQSYAGGISGYQDGENYSGQIEMKNCYNTGNVSANKYAGGLLGYSYLYSKVYYCYSLGNVSATTNFGGCFGSSANGKFCYFLDEAVTNPTNNYGTPKSEDQLKKATTFEQWDFETVWTMAGREDYPYPEIIGSYPVLPEDSIHKHEYTSEITTPATHTSTGVMTFTCECGESYTEIIDKIATHNHIAIITEPTCTEQGYTTYTCECGDTYISDYVDATGHSEGNKQGNCSNCGEHICDHDCHKSGITVFFWKIVCFFCKLFASNKFCECGKSHY